MSHADAPSMNTQIYEEASDWIIQNRDGELDESEKHNFDAWLRRSPDHVRAYLEMSSIWEDVSTLDSASNPRTDELITRARAADNIVSFDVVQSQTPGSSRAPADIPVQGKSKLVFPRPLLAASIVIACLGVGVFAWLSRGPDYSTGIGEQRSITLADGSTVDLNARSRIKVRFSEHEREIDLLEGQALFHVAKNKERPFIVNSAGTAVRAVGTEFDVYQKSGTTVTVLEGRVSVLDIGGITELAHQESSGTSGSVHALRENFEALTAAPTGVSPVTNDHHAVLLSAGEQLTVASNVISQPAPANIAAATAWTQHRLVFDSATLTDVAEEFNRYNARRLIIEDPTLSTIRISGVFSSVDPTLFLRFLRAQSEISVQEKDKTIRVSRK